MVSPLLAALPACGDAGTGEGPPDKATAALTYYADAKPIIDAYCTGCHHAGGSGSFPLTTYEEIQPLGAVIAHSVAQRRMPPWPPSRECTEYVGDRSLSDEQIATLVDWIDTGAARGDPAEEGPPLPEPGNTALSRVDLTLSMPAEYTPQNPPDEYRCFVLPWPRTRPTYITGFAIEPGARAMVHHVIPFLVPPERAAALEARDAADEGPGYDCLGEMTESADMPLDWLGAWAPGAGPQDFPEGTGIAVPPGSRVLLEVHYNLAVRARPDLTRIHFALDDQVEREARLLPWLDQAWREGDAMKIPAGQHDVAHAFAADPTATVSDGQPLRIHEVALHMHRLGTRGLLRIDRADGTKDCLLHIPKWKFHRQESYRLAEPAVLEPGDELYLECRWDNTTGHDVVWGQGTSDEMCLGLLYVTED